MKKINLLSHLVILFSVFMANAQCTYTGTPLTQVGSDYTFCIDNVNTYTTGTVNAGQYVVVNVVKGFTYTFSVGNVFSTTERLTILDASTNGNVSPSTTASGSSGASITGWVASLSGKIKVLLSRGSCSNDNTTGGAITLTLTAVGNTQDSQTAYGTDQWIGHVYNWTGSAPPGGTSPSTPSATNPFTSANYVGYYSVPTEAISETFGGDYNCFPVYSNGVVRTTIYTEMFAVRYRMHSTKTGCYLLSATGDDGMRVYVDGVKVYDEWKEQSPTSYTNVLLYLNGNSDIIFDYYENGGNNVDSFSLTPFDTSSNTIAQSSVTVCSGVSPGVLDGTSYTYSASASNPTISFQWQSSTDNSTFTNISGGTAEDYTPPTQTTSTSNIVRYYRRVVTAAAATASGCSYISNVTTVVTSPSAPASPGTIAGTTSQCQSITGQVYSISAIANTLVYNWTVPTGWTITSGTGTNTITVTTGTVGQNGNISVSATNGCGTSSVKNLAVTVNANNTVGSASSTPTLCINTALTTITHTTTGATGIGTATGLPTGVTAAWATNTITISGTPTASGTFNYTIPLTGGCGTVNATGTITVTPAMTAGAASSTPTVCINTALTAITHTTTGATGIGTATGLPTGVTAAWATNTITISGTPTASGTFNYTIPLTGGCGTVNATGTITVTPAMTAGAASSTPTVCISTALTAITHTTTGATGIGAATGLPTGVTTAWATNTITISGTPTASGTFNYTIPLTGGCGTVNATGTITVTPAMTAGAASSTPTLCISTALTAITHTTTGATGIGTATGLPAGVTAAWATNTITISGTPTASGTFNYTIPVTGGCGTVNATGTITVTPAMTAGAASSTPTLCISTALTAITHTTTGATGIGAATGLPAGVTAAWATNTITISGTPTASGTFNYTIPVTGGCGTVNATGTITVTPAMTAGAASSTPTLCISTALTAITHTTTGATGIGTATGLPAGVTAAWATNTITISGTPTASGTFNYTIPVTGGCGTVNATGTITVTPNKTASAPSSTPTLCINTALTAITHTTTGATGIGTATGLPTGVTAAWATNTITISGTPTASGTFNYTIPLTGGCGSVNATGTITVTPAMTASAASSTPTLCINTALTAITHTTTGATGIGTATGLPTGVTAAWATNTITISGTPTASGTFNYTIPLTGGCGTVNATGTITVTPTMTAGAASSTPTLCINTALTAITHTTTGATGIGTATGLPTGVTAAWATNTITISGTPTASGTFNYTIPLTGGCGTVNATGTITVTPAMTAGAASSTPTLCISTALTAITHATTGATGIGTATGLPTGVTAAWATNTITISGTPTASGTFNYTIPLTGGCGTVNATGTITVTPNKTASAPSSTPTLCINTALTAITHTTTGATGIGTATGLPTGVTAAWATNTITISGTPTASGTFNYTIPLTGGCGTVNATGTITVTPAMTASAASSTPTVCINTALTAITHTTTGATGIGTATGLPTGVTAAWATNTITISGTPTASGTFNYTIPLTGGCGTVNATGTITVTPAMTAGAASSTPTLCISTALTAITHATTGATGIGTATGLPTGVTAAWATNKITISGTPTASGTFNYTIPLTGGCGTVNATGTITVTSAMTASAASSAPTVCISTALTAITHTTTGATGIGTATGLPTGVTAAWSTNTITISGTPTASGTFNYTIPLTGGCGSVNATGTITVTPTMTAGAALSTPTLCINTALTAITHTTTGATGIGTATGLPTGVTAAWATNTITISGTPTASGTFNYTIPVTGGCGIVNATGTITVTPNKTVSAPSSTPTLCINTALTAITHTTTGATGIGTATGLPTGVTAAWATNTITISGTPTASGTFNYTIPLTGGCGTVNATGTITVTPNKTASAPSSTPTVCINTALTAITHTTAGATGIGTATGLPTGVSAAWATNTITISGTPTASGTFNYTIPLTGGCGTVNATGTITVTPAMTAGAASSTPTVCINTALTAITHTTTGATGIGAATGLPTGVTAAWATNTITISGTPTTAGTFNYTIPLTGGCGTVNATGTITVSPLAVGGTISGSANVCSTGNTTTLTLSGYTGSIVKWQSCPTSGFASNVTDIANTTTTQTVYSLTTTTYYRAVISSGSCATAYSATANITVTTAASGNFAYAAYGFCNSISASQSVATSNFTGVAGTYSATTGLTLNTSTGAIVPSTSTVSSTAYTVTYTVPATGGCPSYSTTTMVTIEAAGTGTITYSPSSICTSTAGTISPTISGAGGTGAATWVAATPTGISIDGAGVITPIGSTAGTYTVTYNRSASSLCPAYSNSTTVILTASSSATAGSASATPTVCITTALTPITHTTTGATGIGTATGLPTGVTASWASNTITISGTPTVSGTFTYTIPLTIGCGTVNATGTITVTPNKTVSAALSTPTVCINTALTPITHTTTGATGIGTATGLPTGVTAAWATNTITISGTPTASGTFTYTIPLTGGCGTVNATGTITVTPAMTAGAASSTPTVCISTALTTITHTTTGATGIGTATGLPTGVTATWATNTITISGTPTVSGTFNYTIPLTGGCNSVNATGTITIRPSFTAGAISTTGETICYGGAPITAIGSTTAASGGNGAIVYKWQANGVDISNSNSATYDPPAGLTATTTYTRYAKDGTCNTTFTLSSGSWVITVTPSPAGGTVTGGTTVCPGATASALTLSGNTGPVLRWESSVTPFTTWTPIVNTATTYTPSGITQTTKFRAVVGSTTCGTATATPATIEIKTTTWDGTVWNNGDPILSSNLAAVVLAGKTFTSSGVNINACSLTVESGATVTISSGDSVTLSGALTAATGSFVTFNNNANLLQGGTTNPNSGDVLIKRNSTALMRQDYTLWSTPVTGTQTLIGFSPLTLTSRFYQYDSNANSYSTVTPSTVVFSSVAAKGYLIRVPNNHPTTPTIWTGQFTGVPNNGDYSITLADFGAGKRYNLVGNPYPSPIDPVAFVTEPTNAANTTGHLFFWRKTNNPQNTTPGYATPSYSDWTYGVGYNPIPDAPTWNEVIQTGQGFFVEGTGNGTTVKFTNAMRINNHENQFFKSATTVAPSTSSTSGPAIERNRIWLKVTNSVTANYSQTLLGYVTNATLGVDANIDGLYINDGDIALATLIGTTPYSIQGRPLPFDAADVVPLHFKVVLAGQYTFALSNKDGLFANGQSVYIRDNLTGVLQDITSGSYTFSSEVGTFDTRFEIVYQTTLGITPPTFNENQVVIYTDPGNNIVIKSGNENMSTVTIFDIKGQLLLDKKDINANQISINVGFATEVLLVQVRTQQGNMVTKKVLFQRTSLKVDKNAKSKEQLANDE